MFFWFFFQFSSLGWLAFRLWLPPSVSFVLLLGSFLYTSCVCFGTFWLFLSQYICLLSIKKKVNRIIETIKFKGNLTITCL